MDPEQPQNNQTPPASPKPQSEGWERDAITRLAFAGLQEQRKARRWSIFFRSLGFLYLFLLLFLFLRDLGETPKPGKHTALVDLQGVIAEGSEAAADEMVAGLRSAFKHKNTVGVILRINSPGGSPVQAGYINDEIRRLREEYPDIPLYAVISDICASGGYYVAAAADKIYADKASIVGSIGVRMDSFGFVEAIDKLGVERRLMTAGDHKGLMDPFLPIDATEQAHLQKLLDNIHTQFIDVVKQGRGERLADDERIFSGLIWTGEEALDLGLIDEFGSAGFVAREVIGEEDIMDFTPRKDFFERLATNIGASMARGMASVLTEAQLR